MFSEDTDVRLSEWSQFRKKLETSTDPLQDVAHFWARAPFIPYNRRVDPYNQRSWPTPWEIIVHNQYDDFTKALMMAWTLKLTDRFKRTQIEIKTIVNHEGNSFFNLVVVDGSIVLNYTDGMVVNQEDIPDTFRYENLIEVLPPR